jgi:hypothetical protein
MATKPIKPKKAQPEGEKPTDIDQKRKMADLIIGQIRTTYGQGSMIKISQLFLQDHCQSILRQV